MEVAERQTILAPGDMLGCYRIESFLGQGGFGVTYIARDTMLDIQVVIKEYLPERIAERVSQSTVQPRDVESVDVFRRGLANFLKEARTLAKFKHPNIVRVMSVFELNMTAYMVMEYERGHDLKLLFTRRQHVSEQALKAIMGPIIDGLDEVHRHGFIHRDIKPANILVRDNGSPVLLDFGSARLAVGQATDTLTAMVTSGFAPLEQYSGLDEQQGPWTDLYALGAVLYYAVTGNAPADSTLRGAAVLNDREDPLVPLTVIAPAGYSHAFCRAVDWALQFKVSNRPQTSQQWRARLFNGESEERIVANTTLSLMDAHTVPLTRGKPDARRIASDEKTVIKEQNRSRRSTDNPIDTFEFQGDSSMRHDDWDVSSANHGRSTKLSKLRRRNLALGILPLFLIAVFVAMQFWQAPTTVPPQAALETTQRVPANGAIPDAEGAGSEEAGIAEVQVTQQISQTEDSAEIASVDYDDVASAREAARQQSLAAASSQRAAEEAEKLRVAAAREAQRDIDRAVQRTEALRQAQLQELAEAAAAAERARLETARREAERQAQQQAVEQASQREAERAALKRNAVKPVIDDGDMSVVLARFDALSTAIKQRNGEELREITVPSERKYAYFDYVFRTFDKVEVNVRNIRASRQDQTIRATLYIQRMIRSNGDIAIPPDEFRSIPIYSVKETQWSAIHW